MRIVAVAVVGGSMAVVGGSTAHAHPDVERRGGQWEVLLGGSGCMPARADCHTDGSVDLARGATKPSFGTGAALGWRSTRWLFVGAAYRFGLFQPRYELDGLAPYDAAYQHGVFGVLRPIIPVWRLDLGLDLAPGWAADCHESCGADEQTTCEPMCDLACSGSCEGRANIDCQLSCQSELFGTCEEQVVQECRQECETNGLAIFCNGQFCATGGNLQACADAIAEHFDIHLDVDVDIDITGDGGDGECDGDPCEDGDGDDLLACNASFEPDVENRPIALGLVVLLGLGAWRLRRREPSASA